MISPGSAPSPDALYESADRGAKQISATGASLADWTPSSWRAREALQQPKYEDEDELSNALAEIANRPPLVFAGEARSLQAQLANAAADALRVRQQLADGPHPRHRPHDPRSNTARRTGGTTTRGRFARDSIV